MLEKFLIRAALGDAAVGNDDDLACGADGGQAVRNDERGAIFASSSNACWIFASVSVSSALVASSRMRIGGFLRKMRAMEMRCFCPPDRSVPRSPT